MRSWIFFFAFGCSCSALGQSLPLQTFSSSGGSGPGASLPSLVSNFGQPIAVSPASVEHNLQSGFVPAILTFSNNFPPLIVFTSASIVTVGEKLSPAVTDLDGIRKAMLYFRQITGPEFDSAELTPVAANVFEISVVANYLDDIGMEFYFEAEDNTGRRSRLPVLENEFFHGFKDAAAGDGAFVPPTSYNTGTESDQYKIVTIPYDLSNPGIGSQFDELGQHSKSTYRLATYAGNSEWFEFPHASVNVFERGIGYWFLTTKSDAALFLEGESTPQNYQSNLFQMTLYPEWNQIGNPYPIAIDWNDVIEYNDDPNIGTLKVFNQGYSDGDELKPFEGGFVRYGGPSEVTISIPFKGQVNSGGRKGQKQFTTDLADNQWMLRLTLGDETFLSSLAAIGMHPEAARGEDPFDDFYPPRFADYAEVHFSHTEGVAKEFYRTAVQAEWNFTITSSSSQPLTLSWKNDELGNNNLELFLFDEANAVLVNMRETDHHAVRNGGSYRIFYGHDIREGIAPETVVAGKPYPNPWLTGQAPEVRIPFALPEQSGLCRVQIEIADARGRTVRQVTNAFMSPGFYEERWDGKDQAGQQCTSGMYVVRLTIGNPEKNYILSNRIILQNQQ